MVDQVQEHVTANNLRRYDVTLTAVSDGTGETDATKVEIDDLTMASGEAGSDVIEVASLAVESIEWSMQGYTYIRLYWDTPAKTDIIILSPGDGYFHFGQLPEGGLHDPDKANRTDLAPGNIVLTTVGHSSGDSYTIKLRLIKKAS